MPDPRYRTFFVWPSPCLKRRGPWLRAVNNPGCSSVHRMEPQGDSGLLSGEVPHRSDSRPSWTPQERCAVIDRPPYPQVLGWASTDLPPLIIVMGAPLHIGKANHFLLLLSFILSSIIQTSWYGTLVSCTKERRSNALLMIGLLVQSNRCGDGCSDPRSIYPDG
jgi:hypothetical protein